MTELNYLDITKASDGHIRVPSIGLTSPAITENIAKTALASFSDGAAGIPVKSLLADITPVQNLNGQSAPYPAGGGKNKLPITATTSTVSAVTFTINADGTISTSGTASAAIVFNIATGLSINGSNMILSGCPSGGSDSGYYMTAQLDGSWSSVHDTGSGLALYGTVSRVAIVVASGTNMNGKVFSPMIRVSTESSTFAPYSNICPITGWTGMNIYRTGANLWSKSYGRDNPTYLKAGTTLYIKSDMGGFSLWGRKTDGTAYEIQVISANTKSIVTLTYDIVALVVAQGAYDNLVNGGYDLMVSLADFTDIVTGDLSYVPISWEDEAGTVYGGTLDVTNGKLIATVEYKAMTGNMFTGWAGSTVKRAYTGTGYDNVSILMCDSLTVDNDYDTVNHIGKQSAGGRIFVSPSWAQSCENLTQFKSALANNPINAIVTLATPIEYDIDPEAIFTVLGTNNIWADTGDVEVSYCADTKLYIDKVIAAL